MTVQKNVKSFLEVAESRYSKLSVETFAFFFTSKRKYFSKKKKREKKILNLSFDFSPFFQPKHIKYEERTRKESRSRAKKSCFLYEIVLVFNSINTKLLFRHRPSVGDARDGCRRRPGRDKGCTKVSFPQHLTQPEHRLKTLRGFQPSSLETKQAGKVEKGKKRKAGVGGKYYIPNWIAWNFLTHVWKNQITSIKAALLWHQHPLWARRQLTHCLPRDHRDWPQDLCVIPARSRQRSTWTALNSSVKGGGPAWSLRWGVWDRGLQKPLSIHLAHYISLQIIIFLSLGLKRLRRDQTGGFNSQNGFCRQVAVTKAGFLSQITSVVSFKCHSGH